ncbi:TolC family protein [Chryseobacterium sp. MFBS3-17]|uniref:TolC family protein n=1 Tax=Chryseobacterium sp. MFBS3-17 TaxID=2886689 RepID=UPI001D0E0B7B|nr:TolC family protein [Chryseobacterium sp. MFBS3-17]MCC2591174.1 TolC family protein [Chryseobacterium sp. MFBS3-17]
MKKLSFLIFGLAFFGLNAQKKWTLQESVEYALQNNLQVAGSMYNQKIQENYLQIAKREHLPSVSASINNNFSFGEGRDYFGTTQRNDNFTNSANLGADLLLFNNGRLEKNVRKTNYDLEAANYDLEKIKNDISLQVAQQYLQILLNKEIEKIAESALQNATRQYDRAKITTDVGTTPQTVLAEAEAALAREKQNLNNAQINTSRSLFDLAQLLRLEDYKNFDVQDVDIQQRPQAPLHSTENIIDIAFQNQPQIKAAESRIKSAETQTEIAETAFWPTISASAGIGSSYFNSLVKNNGLVNDRTFFQQYADTFGQQIGVSANIPVFNKGITRLQVEQTKINQEIARNTLAMQRQEVLQNVQRSQFDAEANYQSYLAAVEAEKSSALAMDYAEKSYNAGRTTIYDLNVARNNFANARGSVAQSKYNYLFSLKLLNFYAGIPITLD